MTENTRSNIQVLQENYTSDVQISEQKPAVWGAFILFFTGLVLLTATASPALAQDKQHPGEILPPKYSAGRVSPPVCDTILLCRLKKLMRLLEALEFEFYLELKLYLKFRIGPDRKE